MTHVIYLDRYHLGDPLFLNRLARDLATLPDPRILVHGPGEDGERLLEAEGAVTSWQEGVLVTGSDAEREIVERATRDLNRRIAAVLNDAGVAAVRVDGASRGLFLLEDDRLRVGEVDWLERLTRQGAVPVVAGLVASAGGPMLQVSGGLLGGLLSAHLDEAHFIVLAAGALPEGDASPADLRDDVFGEHEIVPAALRTGARVVLARPRDIGAGGIHGLRLQ